MRVSSLLIGACCIASAIALLGGPAYADNTITGVVRDCGSQPVPGVLIYFATVGSGQDCSITTRQGCRVTDANGSYSYPVYAPNPSAIKFCLYATPRGDGWGGCAACFANKCCNGSAPALTTASVSIPAYTDNTTYTVNIGLTYSGACDAGDGGITDLGGANCASSKIMLAWTAPTDSGCPVVSYDIRYSTAPINDSNWASASQLTSEPAPAAPGTMQEYWADGLTSCTWYYFAMKAELRSGGSSPLSNVPSARTKCPPSSICEIGE